MIDKEKYFTITVVAEDRKDNKIPKSNGFILTVPGHYEREVFFDETGIPNEIGAKLISKLLIEALSGNIHMAHQKENIDSAEHLREAIDMLEDLFVENFRIDVGFEDKKGWLQKKKK